jgi:hypothetical protein
MPDQPIGDLSVYPEGYFVCSSDSACIGDDRLSDSEYTEALKARFDRMDRAFHPERLGQSSSDNSSGALSWSQSYILRAYLEYFEATGDAEVMERAGVHVRNMLAMRDDVRGVRDFRGNSGPHWTTSRYSLEPMPFLVTDGMIVSSMAEFARRVLANPALASRESQDGRTLGTFANSVLDRVVETLDAYDRDWDNSAGAYRAPVDATFLSYAGRTVPFNWEAAMARAMVALHRVRPSQKWATRMESMARRFRGRWQRRSDDTVYWTYWGDTSDTVEDISHAHLNATWMHESWQAGILFTYSDLVRVASSFARNAIKPQQNYSFFLDGTGNRVPVTTGALWLPLATFDSRIFNAPWSFLRAAVERASDTRIAFNGTSPAEMLAVAQMLQYRMQVLGR